MHESDIVRDVLSTIQGKSFEGVLTRYVDLVAYQSVDPSTLLYDEGPPRRGQRYTPKDGPKGLYMSEDIPCALAEYRQQVRGFLCPDRASTEIQLNLEVKCRSVLDLGNQTTRRSLGISTVNELKQPWLGMFEITGRWPPTWILGKLAFESERFDAIRFPSAKANRKYCYVIFTDRLSPKIWIRVVGGAEVLELKTGTFPLKL